MPRPTGDSARDRVNLYLSLVPWLIRRGTATIDEAAAQFGVSRSKIIEAMVTIACDGGSNEARLNFDTELCNIDWDKLAFDWDRYEATGEYVADGDLELTVAETLRSPAPFSARQRAMFLAGLELLKVIPHYRRLPELAELIAKLRGDGSAELTNVFSVALNDDPLANLIEDAIESERRVRFAYTNNQGVQSVREVDPYRQDVDGANRYLKGYCYLRNDVLTFNLDSIEQFEVLDVAVEPRDIDALALAGPLFVERDDDLQVGVSIDSQAMPLIAAYRRPGDRPVSRGDFTNLTIPFTYPEPAVRMISVLAGVAQVTEPHDVRAKVAAHATAALAAYGVEPTAR
jgi:proteasome accessory factor C